MMRICGRSNQCQRARYDVFANEMVRTDPLIFWSCLFGKDSLRVVRCCGTAPGYSRDCRECGCRMEQGRSGQAAEKGYRK